MTVDVRQHSEVDKPAPGRRVRPYDFAQQEILDRTRLRRLQPILDVLAHRIAGGLTSTLRQSVRVGIGEVEQQRWETYAAGLPEPTFLSSAAVSPFGGRIVLHLPLDLALTMVEVRLGGAPSGGQPARPLTEIEQRLVSETAQHVLAELPPAYASVLNIGIGAIASVSSSMFLPSVKPTEMCLLISMLVEVGDVGSFAASLCFPMTVLLPILEALERLDTVDGGTDVTDGQADVRMRLQDVPVDAALCFPDIGLSPEELLSLMPGDVVALHHEAKAPLILRVGGTSFCQMVATSRGKRLAGLVVEDQESHS